MVEESFEKVVVDLVRRFSPQKKHISIPATSLNELKEVVRTSVLSSPRSFMVSAAASQVTFSNGNGHSYYGPEDEDSRMSGFDSSEDSHSMSQYSYEDESSRGTNSGCRRLFKTASGSSLSQQPKGYKQSTRARRLQELRQSRRKATRTEDFHNFDCSEKDFPPHFSAWYSEELNSCSQPVYLYHVIVNSTREFFTKITWDRNIENLMMSFLREHVLLSSIQLNELYEGGSLVVPEGTDMGRRRLAETQLQILLELHLMSMGRGAKGVEDVVRKLRFIYIVADAIKMRSFLDEEIADNFAHLIPKEVVMIYDDLCITVPVDLEEHDPNSGFPVPEEFMFPWFQSKTSSQQSSDQSKQLEKLLEESALSDSGSNSGGKENSTTREHKTTKTNGQRRRAEKRKTNGVSTASSSPSSTSTHSASTRHQPVARRIRTVEDTPEEKQLRVKQEPEDEEGDAYPEVVKQTPMGKLRASGSRRESRRLSELLRISEERMRPTRAAAIASEKASKAIVTATLNPNSCRAVLFGLNTPSPRPQRLARSNLISRFCSEGESGPSTSTASQLSPRKAALAAAIKPASRPEPSTPDRKRSRQSSAVASPAKQQRTGELNTGIVGFGKEQLNRYKQRMTEISRMKEADLAAGSYKRTSLYEGTEEASGTDQKQIQKNRTGRTVRTSTTVHLAHILLNVNNPAPLEAFKTTKLAAGAPYKLQKLVRIAKKREKKKLNRLRNRVVRFNHADSPSTSQKSDSMEQ